MSHRLGSVVQFSLYRLGVWDCVIDVVSDAHRISGYSEEIDRTAELNCRYGGTADTADSKSADSNIVSVQVRLATPMQI